MITDSVDVNKIARYTGMSIDQVKQLEKDQ